MDYPSIWGGDLPYCGKNSTCNLLIENIDAHSKILIDEYTGDGVQSISILQSQCADMTFAYQIIYYNRLFQKVVHKRG